MNQRIFHLHASEARHVRRWAILYSTVQRRSEFLRILFDISVAILRLTILDRGPLCNGDRILNAPQKDSNEGLSDLE